MSNGSAFQVIRKPYAHPVGRGRPTEGGVHGVERV